MHSDHPEMASLDLNQPVWRQTFTVAPLIVVGSRNKDGSHNLAPKHMSMPFGWENYFGFICTPRHTTYHNIARTGEFTASYPRPDQLIMAALAAGGRDESGEKPRLEDLTVWPAKEVDGVLLAGAYLHLECQTMQILDEFGENSLIVGRIVAAHADAKLVRLMALKKQDVLQQYPLLAFINWGRVARISESVAFPLPGDFEY